MSDSKPRISNKKSVERFLWLLAKLRVIFAVMAVIGFIASCLVIVYLVSGSIFS